MASFALISLIVIHFTSAEVAFKSAESDEIGQYTGAIVSTDWKLDLKKVKNELQIEAKNSKSKRVFLNSFNESTLKAMDLNVPIRKVIKMLQVGKEKNDETQYNISLTMGFCEAETLNQNKIDEIEMIEFTSQFSKGNMMVLILTVDELFFDGQFIFPLTEKKREETDILNDIIADLQDEIATLKQEIVASSNGQIMSFKSSKQSNPVQWNVINMDTTGNKLAIRSNSNQNVQILKKGTYRISLRVGWGEDWNTSADMQLKKNGAVIANMKHYYSFNIMFVEIFVFNVNDQLQVV
eukprot:467127_1